LGQDKGPVRSLAWRAIDAIDGYFQAWTGGRRRNLIWRKFSTCKIGAIPAETASTKGNTGFNMSYPDIDLEYRHRPITPS
jgi:hypothetical protein